MTEPMSVYSDDRLEKYKKRLDQGHDLNPGEGAWLTAEVTRLREQVAEIKVELKDMGDVMAHREDQHRLVKHQLKAADAVVEWLEGVPQEERADDDERKRLLKAYRATQKGGG